MGLLDSLLGRTKPPPANLDDLFAVPQAVLSLATAGITATGSGAVCFRDVDGTSDDAVITEAELVIGTDTTATVALTDDAHGFRWLTVSRPSSAGGGDATALVADLHAVNSSLVDAGFGASLLCSTINLTTTDGGPGALVYLFKQGTFYPFIPVAGRRRDNAVELQVKTVVEGDLPVEKALERWLAVWDAPGLSVGS